jgi:hypothetical protein
VHFTGRTRIPPRHTAAVFEHAAVRPHAPLMVALWVRVVQRQPAESWPWLGLAFALGLALVAPVWKVHC